MVSDELIIEHLPSCPICGNPSGYTISGIMKNYVQCNSCKGKWHIRKDKETWQLKLHELPQNEKSVSLYSLLEEYHPFDFWKELEVGKVNWKNFPKPPTEIASVISLDSDENVLAAWEGSYIRKTTRLYKGTEIPKYERKEGCVLLTSRRFVGIEKRGVFSKSYYPTTHISLEKVRGVSKGVTIIDDQGETIFSSLRNFGDRTLCRSVNLIPVFRTAVKLRKAELASEKKKERVQIVLDFSSLKDYMEKGGLMMQTFRCPHCSAPVEFPEKGKTTKCDHCGSKIYARDIFEKIKELIG